MVLPSSRLSSASRSSTSAPVTRSRSPVGSSATIKRRVGDERARDRHALLLAAGELVRIVVHAVGEAHHVERGQHMRVALAAREPCQQQRQLDVLERGQHRHQVVELEDEADVRGAPVGELAFAQRGDVDAADLDAARSSACRCRRSGSAACSCPSRSAPSARRTRLPAPRGSRHRARGCAARRAGRPCSGRRIRIRTWVTTAPRQAARSASLARRRDLGARPQLLGRR